MRKTTNKQRAANFMLEQQATLRIEDERIILATILAASTLEGRKKDEFQTMIQQVIQKVKSDKTIQDYFFQPLSEAEAKKLYEDAKDIVKGKFHENPDWKIKLPANLTLSLGQAIGCGTSVFKGATKAQYSFTAAFALGLSTFGANFFFISQAVPDLLSKMGVDCQNFADNASIKLALTLIGQELLRGIFVASAAGVDTTFAVGARDTLGIQLIGYGQSIMTLLAMGLIYRDELKSLSDKILHPSELCAAIKKALYEDSLALNILRVISVSAGITRAVAFAYVAEGVYKYDLDFGSIFSVVAAIASIPPEAALITFAALDAADFFYERGVKFASNVRGGAYLAYETSSKAIRSIPLVLPRVMRSLGRGDSQVIQGNFEELREEEGSNADQQNIGMMTALCNIMGRLHPQIANYLPRILIMAVLIANATGNVFLSDSENLLVLASIWWVSFSVCSKSIFKDKALENADEIDRKIKLLRGNDVVIDPENPQSLRNFFNNLVEDLFQVVNLPINNTVSVVEDVAASTEGLSDRSDESITERSSSPDPTTSPSPDSDRRLARSKSEGYGFVTDSKAQQPQTRIRSTSNPLQVVTIAGAKTP